MVNRCFQRFPKGETFAGLARQKAVFAGAENRWKSDKYLILLNFISWHGGCKDPGGTEAWESQGTKVRDWRSWEWARHPDS
jgi:hypothetical protein